MNPKQWGANILLHECSSPYKLRHPLKRYYISKANADNLYQPRFSTEIQLQSTFIMAI